MTVTCGDRWRGISTAILTPTSGIITYNCDNHMHRMKTCIMCSWQYVFFIDTDKDTVTSTTKINSLKLNWNLLSTKSLQAITTYDHILALYSEILLKEKQWCKRCYPARQNICAAKAKIKILMTSDKQGKAFVWYNPSLVTFFLAALKVDLPINHLNIPFGLIQTTSSFQGQSDILS